MRRLLLWSTALLFSTASFALTYSIDARINPKEIRFGHLKMGNPGPAGKEFLLNNKYLTIDGKPVIPVMGEIHFSRCPREQWEDRILKMKANGINIIATYVFWIHHEETEGQFDWKGNHDLRAFIQLCQKHDLYVYPRIGPWCHGEVRNGGTPDWLITNKKVKDRSNDPAYQFYAERLYKNIAAQMDGLYYKDGGAIIGIQLENEYRRGPSGNAHILWLKQTARKYGMDVPMYTVTGWGNASVPQDEVIPLFGGYPEEPWETNLEPAKENLNFTFEAPMNDEGIGADVAVNEGKSTVDYSRYPYLTCEIGLGNQVSYHRRPILNPFDGLAIATAKTGSGSNLPGYYVFTGGSNPIGKYTTLEENQDETGYWNQYCDISYDFQAAIGETGELAPCYHQIKKLHYFLNEFGNRLAPMTPVVPKNQRSKEELQWSVRVNENAGFVFGMNYYRNVAKPMQKGVQFSINLPEGPLPFPSKPVNVPDSCIFIWPFNFDMDGTLLKYATAQPLCHIDQNGSSDWFFIQNLGINPEFCLDAASISSVETASGKAQPQNGKYLFTELKPGLAPCIRIHTKSGKKLNLTVLSFEQATQSWFFNDNGRKKLYVTDANLYLNGKELSMFLCGEEPETELTVLAGGMPRKNRYDKKNSESAVIQVHGNRLTCSPKIGVVLGHGDNNKLDFQKIELFDSVHWLRTSVKEITPKNKLYHRVFSRQINLDSPSAVKSATLYLYAESACQWRLNSNWLNQDIIPGQLNRIDVTGYLKTGENIILADYPFETGDKAFAGKIVVEYFNSDQLVLKTDTTWLAADLYTLPFNGEPVRVGKRPAISEPRKVNYETNEWSINLGKNVLFALNNAYLHVDYLGDQARCRLNDRLMADHYFNGAPWSIQIKGLTKDETTDLKLNLKLTPLKTGYRVLFDTPFPAESLNQTKIKQIQIIPEYRINLMVP
jgi:hypothetical protein